jgi:hypothetical protein
MGVLKLVSHTACSKRTKRSLPHRSRATQGLASNGTWKIEVTSIKRSISPNISPSALVAVARYQSRTPTGRIHDSQVHHSSTPITHCYYFIIMALSLRCSPIHQHSLPSFFVRSSRTVFGFSRAKFSHSTPSTMIEAPPPPSVLPPREIGRHSRRFLGLYRFAPAWGFVIYRTVYTPESDVLWPRIMEKLEAFIYKSIWYDVNNAAPDAPLDPSPIVKFVRSSRT